MFRATAKPSWTIRKRSSAASPSLSTTSIASARLVTAGSSAGVRFYFVDYPAYFDRDALYGTPVGDYPDNAERFALFSRAVLEASKILGVPHVFHCHDWQSALIPVLLRTVYAEDPAFREVATVFTIHNMGYPGFVPVRNFAAADAALGLLAISKMEFFGQVEFPERRARLLRFRHHSPARNTVRRSRLRNMDLAWKACSASARRP